MINKKFKLKLLNLIECYLRGEMNFGILKKKQREQVIIPKRSLYIGCFCYLD